MRKGVCRYFLFNKVYVISGVLSVSADNTWGAFHLSELAGRTSQLENEIGFFQSILLKKPSPSCILFRIWLIWLDSYDSKWNSHYDGNVLACQFWQMESALTPNLIVLDVKKTSSNHCLILKCIFSTIPFLCHPWGELLVIIIFVEDVM